MVVAYPPGGSTDVIARMGQKGEVVRAANIKVEQ